MKHRKDWLIKYRKIGWWIVERTGWWTIARTGWWSIERTGWWTIARIGWWSIESWLMNYLVYLVSWALAISALLDQEQSQPSWLLLFSTPNRADHISTPILTKARACAAFMHNKNSWVWRLTGRYGTNLDKLGKGISIKGNVSRQCENVKIASLREISLLLA